MNIDYTKVANGKKFSGAIRSLVNGRVLQLEYARIFFETLFVPAPMYGSKIMIWKD